MDHSIIAKSITLLTQKDIEFDWSLKYVKKLDYIKEKLASD